VLIGDVECHRQILQFLDIIIISLWDISKATNMAGFFVDMELFNDNPESWDVSNVKAMSDMFFGAKNFNQPIFCFGMSVKFAI
jgi:hypothetical protein